MRADKFFSQKYGSRTKAQAVLKEGLILRDGVALLPKDEVRENDDFTFLDVGLRFVSAGGKKLERGLLRFSQSVDGETVADLGASTGGFTQCLLEHGAKKVYCVDVGTSLLDERLRTDRRVVVMDKTNARYLKKDSFPEPVSVITGDLSFISLRLVLPSVYDVLPQNGRAFLLFKPQFECERIGLNGNGILPFKYHAKLLASFYDYCLAVGLPVQNITNAPIVEKKNIEYVLFLKKHPEALGKEIFLRRAAEISI